MTISKLEAARRQTDEAIVLFFNDRDPLAIVTLVHAAQTLLTDLSEAKGGATLHATFKSFVVPGKEGELRRALNKLPNFLKHADNDPHDTIDEPPPKYNDGGLAWCCTYYQDLAGSMTPTMHVYFAWFAMLNPSIIKPEYPQAAIATLNGGNFARMDRKDQLDVGRRLLGPSAARR